jgi:hypothetical protein
MSLSKVGLKQEDIEVQLIPVPQYSVFAEYPAKVPLAKETQPQRKREKTGAEAEDALEAVDFVFHPNLDFSF